MGPDEQRRYLAAKSILRDRSDLVRELRQVADALDDPAETPEIFEAAAAREAMERADWPVRRSAMRLRRLLSRVRAYEKNYPDADGAGAGVLR